MLLLARTARALRPTLARRLPRTRRAATTDPLYITTPIYYVNAAPHVGHAYTSVACDAAARFARLDGRVATLVTGTDEHGEKIEESAAMNDCEPLEFATRVSGTFRDLADSFDIKYDRFIRTTDEDHKIAVEALWQKLEENGQIYLGSYEGWYCVRDECFYTEGELVDGKAPTGAEVEWRAKEPSYFFKLSAWGDTLIDLYETEDILGPKSRKNEVLSFLKMEELRDLSISRTSFKWGLQVPNDPDHVVYVWVDALTNYLTAIGFPDGAWEASWRGATHVVGKDILRFHAVYWPAMLLAAGLPPPKKIYAHGWWTKDGSKISKSTGNVVVPSELIDEYGLDATRFFLLSEIPFGADGDFSRTAMLASCNGFLANAVGNLCQRCCAMIGKNLQGSSPALADLTPEDNALLDKAHALGDAMRPHMDQLAFNKALAEVEAVVRDANRYFDGMEPWKLKKTSPERMGVVLAVAQETLRCVAICYQPFMPRSATKMLDLLGVNENDRDLSNLRGAAVAAGTVLPPPSAVFPRVEDVGEVEAPAAPAAPASKPAVDVAAVQVQIDAQGATIRKLKDRGLGNKNPQVAGAVAELLRLKALLED